MQINKESVRLSFGVTVFSLSVSLVATAHADYVGSVVGILPDDSLESLIDVAPGESFTGAVMIDDTDGTMTDSAIFRLEFSKNGLVFSDGWYDWASPYTTGGVDDFSSPSSAANGVLDGDTFMDLFDPSAVDVAFENVTDNAGDFFSTGTLLTFSFDVPTDFELGALTIDFVPDTFTSGASIVDATSGTGLTVNVIPVPSTLALIGVGLVGWRRRTRV